MIELPGIPLIDTRTREELFREMQESLKAKGINIDEGDGEIISALAVIYSNMLYGTIKRLNRTPEKHRAAFLNIAHTPPRPAWPSSGIVAFEVTGGYDNPVEIKKGTRVAADIDGQPISFSLRSDLTAVPANISDIYWCDPSQGRYGYSSSLSEVRPWDKEFTGEPAYKAAFRFKNIFSSNTQAALFIEAVLQAQFIPLCDLLRVTRWSIRPWPCVQDAEDAFTELSVAENPGGWLHLQIDETIADVEYVQFHIELNDPAYSEIIVKDMYLMQLSGSAPPDTVLTNSRRLETSAFYPFGSPMHAFEECGIFCDVALSQKSSDITVSFDLELDISEEWPLQPQEATDYKWIMRKPLLKPNPVVYDAFAKSVRLEYWDGSTYREIHDNAGRALDLTRENSHIVLSFACPEDIVPCEYYGVTGYYLRLSCDECDELYKLPRRVYTPCISDFKFSYRHTEKYYPVKVETESFGKKSEADFNTQGQNILFQPSGHVKTLLLGFDRLVWKCRIKMYVNIKNSQERSDKVAKLEAKIYLRDGEDVLEAFDLTRALTASGALWLDIPENAQPTVLFGKERYWIALPADAEVFPVISGIYLNALLAENKVRYEENFSYSALKNNRVTLAHKNIICAWVYVRSLTGVKMEQWSEYDVSDGKFRSGFYMIDYISGLISFPYDMVGRSVNEDMLDLIRVTYDVTDGDKANLPANSITRMEEDIPFIQSVRNPMAIVGGEKGESGEELASRKRHTLYNGGRIVSKRDFELFAMDNCPLISDANCTYDPASCTVLLKVLIKKDAQHAAFGKVKKNLLLLFEALIPAEMRLDIIPWAKQ